MKKYKNFVIFFDGCEGSTAIITHLKQFANIDIIWFEPFDNCHLKKKLIGKDLNNMFNLVYNNNKFGYMAKINQIYSNYSDKELNNFDKDKSIGFKMRMRNFGDIKNILKNNDVVVFILMRKNILKWAISLYGSNTLQFKLVKKEIDKNPPMTINFDTLKEKIDLCNKNIEKKYDMFKNIRKEGIETHFIYYEDYCDNKAVFLNSIIKKLNIHMHIESVKNIAEKNIYFQKVHDNDLSKFVTNYDELLKFVQENNLQQYL